MRGLPSSFLCHWLIVSCFSILAGSLQAQNLRCKTIPTHQQITLDSIPVDPNAIQTEAAFHFDPASTQILVQSDKDSVEVCYRVLSSLLIAPFQHRDLATYDASGAKIDFSAKENVAIEKEELFDFGGVDKYGAITRGVSFGNRQNLFVNSSLNLQMQGKLDDNLNITASITDQNVPYQPEGNTQQIRDFDNVFIKLYNEQFDITAGDIVLQQPQDAGYFLKYHKNIQGFQASVRGGEDWSYETRVSGAGSKGKFNSAFIEPIDGLTGPYKLRGPNGERFIIVLANSEKVFLDGQLLQRGFDRDYVIDYNLGEITFNNHIIITQFSIIRVDYEYAEQFYSRSNLSAYQKLEKGKVKLVANYYRERDNPNANLGFSLSEEDLLLLGNLGDNQEGAFISGSDSVQFSENRILYEKKDTVDLDGNVQNIFILSTNPNAVLYSPSFSEMGTGNGNYVLVQSTANGRVYEWVSPSGGQPQGNYEPGLFVPLPNQRQLMTIATEVSISDYESISMEGAFSNRDDNLYSDLDDEDNSGGAAFLSVSSKGRAAFFPGYQWIGSFSMEYDQRDFTFIDRYRPILFDRDWNFDQDPNERSEDMILYGNLGWIKDESNKFNLTINRRKRGEVIDGWQQQIDFHQEWGDLQLVSTHFHLSNDQMETEAEWYRSKSDISFRRWKMVPGFIYELDQNKTTAQDSVLDTRMNYRAQEFYLISGDSSSSKFRLSYRLRQDRLPVNGELQDFLYSRTLNGSYQRVGKTGRIAFDVNYRRAEDQLGLNSGQDEVINGRLNWRQSFLNKVLSHDFSFSTGNSRELRREFVFLPVNTGEGTHTWRDLNEDGIQDLNEFFEAINPDERNYIKLFTPTDEYLTAFQTFYLHTIDLAMPHGWRTQGGLKGFASQFSMNVNFNVNLKTTSASYEDRLNPFGLRLSDESLISAQDSKRYTLFFNRNGRGLAADLTHQTNDNKQLLTQGFETRERREWISNFKVDLSKEYTFRLTSSFGRNLNQSDFLESRNLDIVSHAIRPQLIWQPSSQMRMIGSYERKNRQNEFTESATESALTQSYTGELTWNQAVNGSLRATFSVINIDFEGDAATYLGYLLLDGLQPGINQTWQVNWQQKLSKGMQLSLLYNGRKSESIEIIHTGSVQVTAFF